MPLSRSRIDLLPDISKGTRPVRIGYRSFDRRRLRVRPSARWPASEASSWTCRSWTYSLSSFQMSGPLAPRPLGTLGPLEELLEVFITAGFDPHGALHAARLFSGFLYGHVQAELQERIHDPDETEDLLRLGLHRPPITVPPLFRVGELVDLGPFW
jgi:hypothetical protein